MIFSEIMRSLVENLEAWKVESRELPILHRFSQDISSDDVWFLSVQVEPVGFLACHDSQDYRSRSEVGGASHFIQLWSRGRGRAP